MDRSYMFTEYILSLRIYFGEYSSLMKGSGQVYIIFLEPFILLA